LHGELRALPEGANALFATDLAEEPLRIPLTSIGKIQFRPLAKLGLLPSAILRLRDGSWLAGVDVRGLDQRSIEFSTPYTGPLTAPRGAVTYVLAADLQPTTKRKGRARGAQVVPGFTVLGGGTTVAAGEAAALGGIQLVPLDGRSTSTPPSPVRAGDSGRLLLSTGEHFAGSPVSLVGGRLSFRMRLGPEVSVPSDEVACLSLPPGDWKPVAASPKEVSATVTLITGEVWKGTLKQLDAKGLHLGWLDDKTVVIPLGLLHTLAELELGAKGLRQWAESATASSEYGNPQWSAMQATGAPNTMTAGDHQTAWAMRQQNGGAEWLELTYALPVRATRVRVRETYNPGAVVRIEGKGAEGKVWVLWEGRDPTTKSPGWLDVRFAPTKAPIRTIRVHLDTTLKNGWSEIDAVELIGEP